MAGPAQSILNEHVLRDCDLLVGIFWTRIGTRTTAYESGSVEEIERHIADGKDVMLYFSSAPVMLDNLDPEQYELLKKFRNSCQQRSLYESFSSSQDFKEKFSRQLALTIQRNSAFADDGSQGVEVLPLGRSIPGLSARLSREAEALLSECAKSADGTILHLRYIGGQHIQTGGKNFMTDNSPRTISLWEGALNELAVHRLVADVGHKGEIFRISREGFAYYDQLLKS
jgi:hypothetical protein